MHLQYPPPATEEKTAPELHPWTLSIEAAGIVFVLKALDEWWNPLGPHCDDRGSSAPVVQGEHLPQSPFPLESWPGEAPRSCTLREGRARSTRLSPMVPGGEREGAHLVIDTSEGCYPASVLSREGRELGFPATK